MAPIPVLVALEERVGPSPLPGSSYDGFSVAFTISDGSLFHTDPGAHRCPRFVRFRSAASSLAAVGLGIDEHTVPS